MTASSPERTDARPSFDASDGVISDTRSVPLVRVRVRTRIQTPPLAVDKREACEVAPSTAPGSRAGGDYGVGYGKPPVHSRFAPGVSGNRKGRPKGSRSLSALIGEGLDKPITAKVGHRTITMKRREAIAHRLIEQALGGDHRAVALILRLDPNAMIPDESSSEPDEKLNPQEAALLQGYIERLTGTLPEPDQ